MKLLTIILLLLNVNFNNNHETNDELTSRLIKEIRYANLREDFNNEDFFRVNVLLSEYEIPSSLDLLKESPEYRESIDTFFNSSNESKRVFAYRLIGIVKDNSFNQKLIDRINSNEPPLLTTWCAMALMSNNASDASDDLFRVLSSSSSRLPLSKLINKYLDYDETSVKDSCWKYIDSSSKSEQIMAIQFLSGYGKNTDLQSKLKEFLNDWEDEYKGWVISAMAIQEMSNLKPLLKDYYRIEFLQPIIIEALENSSLKADNDYAMELTNKR